MTPSELKDLADVKFDRSVLLKNLRESAYAKLGVVHNGGSFTASPALISYLSARSSAQLYLEDNYNNPILVNRTVLLELAILNYDNTMTWWATEFNQGNRIRRASGV